MVFIHFGRLAHLDRALASEAKGGGFESRIFHEYHKKKPGLYRVFLFTRFSAYFFVAVVDWPFLEEPAPLTLLRTSYARFRTGVT